MPYMVRTLVRIAMTNICWKQHGPQGHSPISVDSVHMKHGKQQHAYIPTHTEKFLRFLENDPLRWNFQSSVPKVFIATPIDVLCSNFVKFGWRELGEIVRYVPDKKKQNFTWLSSFRYCADRTQNQLGPAPTVYSECCRFHPKSIHFMRSYSQTREHCQNAP